MVLDARNAVDKVRYLFQLDLRFFLCVKLGSFVCEGSGKLFERGKLELQLGFIKRNAAL